MLWKLGLNPGEKFLEWLSTILERDGVETSRKLLDRMATIPEGLRIHNEGPLVPDQSKPPLSLVAADVSTQTKVDFPRMAPLYWPDPDEVDPAQYVRASISLPAFFS